MQGTYDGVTNSGALDNTDIRLAHYADLASHRLVFGVSVNNNPTVQDLWNTTPAWGFPWRRLPLLPRPPQDYSLNPLARRCRCDCLYDVE